MKSFSGLDVKHELHTDVQIKRRCFCHGQNSCPLI